MEQAYPWAIHFWHACQALQHCLGREIRWYPTYCRW